MWREPGLLLTGLTFLIWGTTQSQLAQSQTATRPDLSGKWAVVSGPGVIADSPLFEEGTITQDERSVTFTSGGRSRTFQFDGSESRNTTTTAVGAQWILSLQARWVSSALLVSTKTDFGGTSRWEDILICSLSGKDTLKIVTVNTVIAGGVMSRRLLSYKRQP